MTLHFLKCEYREAYTEVRMEGGVTSSLALPALPLGRFYSRGPRHKKVILLVTEIVSHFSLPSFHPSTRLSLSLTPWLPCASHQRVCLGSCADIWAKAAWHPAVPSGPLLVLHTEGHSSVGKEEERGLHTQQPRPGRRSSRVR